MNLTSPNRDSEIQLIKKLNEIEIGLYKVKNSLILGGICLALIFTGLGAVFHKLLH
ncbi:hypothetical protein [Rickettsiella endosymbiont of Miltochrista miniata]|uniref:hypothetical protein n=1 Tax=Rickettsiella endosymbiont of Miltochrista miniata TaxID=3066239 RepID=UPI00313E598F